MGMYRENVDDEELDKNNKKENEKEVEKKYVNK